MSRPDPVPAGSAWSFRKTAALASLFWLLTFAAFSTGAYLAGPSAYRFLEPARVAATVIGALFFAAVLDALARRDCGSLAEEARLILGRAGAAAASIALVRLVLDLHSNPHTPTLEQALPLTLRWLMIWIAYFLGWSAFYLVLRYHRALADQRQLLAIVHAPPAAAPAQEAAPEPEILDALWVDRNRQRVRVPVDRIEWLEAEGDYVRLHAGEGGGMIRMTLANAERLLAPHGFVRVHKSVVCRRDAVVALARSPSGALKAQLASGDRIPVGRRFREALAGLTKMPGPPPDPDGEPRGAGS